ncbi:hypothetical protein R3P38DRAFT_3128369 [Favolaschia claudopus]|uniref:Vacuolar protein sorting-associated protein 13 second N-terminal domain-containing protein n=1 Tax=Favolaschia claudopus TaxID=2862362 RepID=A0AAV9ZAU5_9AGAR
MHSFSKIFKRHRTRSVIDDEARALAAGPSDFSHLSLAVPVPDLRHSTSMPHLVLPQNGLPIGAPNGTNERSTMIDVPPVDQSNLKVSIPNGGGDDSKLLPPTPSSRQVSPARSELGDTLGEMWHNIEDRSANLSKAEKVIDKISDAASTAIDAQASSEGVVGLVKSVMANDEVKAIGNAILEGVPAIMSALEVLTEVHPFLKAAYLPFKLIYHQETQRRDNDRKRTTLFGKIKDVMMILLDLKSFGKDDTRTTPEGKPVLSRLASICQDMKKDIEECYNVLNVQEKRSLGIKFLKASIWNKELGSYAARFTNRREELTFALSLRSVVTIEEMNNKMMQMFSTMLTPQERDMGRWIQLNGGEKTVMKDDKKCAAMIKYQDSLTATTATVTVSHDRGGRLPLTVDDDGKKTDKLIAELRKEYREDVRAVIRENMESYSKRFAMGLEDLGKDLGNKIQHQGDRLIKYLRGGPHQRIKDKIVYRVWKDQGWRGSAKTRVLVLALRDYLVERVEHSKLASLPTEAAQKKRPVSKVPTVRKDEDEGEDEDDDPETDISVPLPDSWMTSYLQVKRLRYLEQALDPDSSGFTTISEINGFSHARPTEWSFPHWVSYWAIGWQIYATKYCVEIEELFGQMLLLKKQITIKMPGNTRYLNEYIEGCWQHVTALTSSIERYDGPETWLEEKFAAYIQAQESMLKERLEKIQYDIDALDTVALILRGDRIEGSIFVLLAILLRRHVAKMHIALKQELHHEELFDDMDTVTWVVYAAWMRFLDLKEQFQHQEVSDLKLIFDWLSCGLFKSYYEWDNWIKPEHFMENDMTVWTSDTLNDLDPSALEGILVHGEPEKSPAKPECEDSVAAEPASNAIAQDIVEGTPSGRVSPVPTVEAPTTDHATVPEPSPTLTKPSEAEMSITGKWYGFHWTEGQTPFLAMTCINIKCGDRVPDSESETEISGDGTSVNSYDFTLLGTLSSADQPANTFAVSFERTYTDDGTWIQYTGTYFPDREIMTGTFTRSVANGDFLLKKVPESAIMCARPLVRELNPKELWAFAIKAVVDDIKRRKPRLPYLCSRMTDVRRVLRFIYRDNRDLLDADEQVQYSALLRTFSFEQMVEVNKLLDWYDHAGNLQPANHSCDGCSDDLARSRIVCLECVSSDNYERTLETCSKLDCIAAEVPHRTDVSHNPKTHLMVRFRDLLLLRDYYSIKQSAGYSIQYARDAYEDPTPDLPLTTALPASPVAGDGDGAAAGDVEVKVKVAGEGSTENDAVVVTAIVGGSIAPPAAGAEKPASPVDLPPLNTGVAPPEQSHSSPTHSEASSSSSASSHLLSAAVTPVEQMVYDYQQLKCTVCQERVVAPCWYCVTCYMTWVCDSCESAVNDLLPWDYVKRYRTEVEAGEFSYGHNLMHPLVRVTGFKSDGEALKSAGGDKDADADAKTQGETARVKWEEVEKRLEELVTVQARLDGVERRLGEVETKLETRLANIERLLSSLVGRVAERES